MPRYQCESQLLYFSTKQHTNFNDISIYFHFIWKAEYFHSLCHCPNSHKSWERKSIIYCSVYIYTYIYILPSKEIVNLKIYKKLGYWIHGYYCFWKWISLLRIYGVQRLICIFALLKWEQTKTEITSSNIMHRRTVRQLSWSWQATFWDRRCFLCQISLFPFLLSYKDNKP